MSAIRHAAPILIALSLLLPGCSHVAATHKPTPPVPKPPAPLGTPVRPGPMLFIQDGLHNCGSIAMLLSWTALRPTVAAQLVRKLPNHSYQVTFQGSGPITVTPGDLAAASKARMLRAGTEDAWANIVLTAFVKLKCGASAVLDFTVTDWMYAGEMGYSLSGLQAGTYDIKPESMDAKGRIEVGKPVPLAEVAGKLAELKGKPAVASTNRRIHVWAILDYDPKRQRVLARNPRKQRSKWMSASAFRDKFQVIFYQPE